MKEEQQRIALAELYGFSSVHRRNKLMFGLFGIYEEELTMVPNFVHSLDYLHKMHSKLGLMDRNNNTLRVKWVNNLRTIVSRKIPKNKSGMALTSDVDLLLANPEEIAESILKTFNKWEE